MSGSERLILASRRICDGTGRKAFAGRVVVEAGRIVALLPYAEAAEGSLIELGDRVLAPGFIDAHGHSDLAIFAAPEAVGKAAQGIVTEIAGNCGLSAFPVTAHNRDHLAALWRRYGGKLPWPDGDGYRRALAAVPTAALEIVPLVGHNTLRAAVAGYEKRRLAPEELTVMTELLAAELAAGAPGMSTGLGYVPGKFADAAELVALLKVVARYDGVYATHLRSEGAQLEEALAETLRLAREAGVHKVHLSHLKTAGAENFHKLDAILAALETRDLRVTGDVYPYAAAMSPASFILPSPYDDWDDEKLMNRLRNADEFARALAALRAARPAEYWTHVELIAAECGGRTVADAARGAGLDAAEFYLDQLRADAPGAAAVFHTLSAANLDVLLTHDHVVAGSDESVRPLDYRCGRSHPRGFGTMPEFLRRATAAGVAWEAAVGRMTGRTAEIFALRDVGTIAVGRTARLVTWREGEFRAEATYAEPHRLAVGLSRIV